MSGSMPPPRAAPRSYSGVDQGPGWLTFAGAMLALVGVLNVMYGIAATSHAKFFFRDVEYVFGNLSTWGWFMIVLGATQILAAFSIWAGNRFGRWFGITCAVLNAIAALLAIPAYPFWSLVVIGIDILVIYGLAAYGGDKALARR